MTEQIRRWTTGSGWEYLAFPTDSVRTPFPVFDPLLAIWNSKRDGEKLPAWRDFEMRDFVGWHAHLVLFEVRHDPFDLYFRLCGTAASETYGANLTGTTLRDMSYKIENKTDLLYFRALVDERLIGVSTGPEYWHNREHIKLCYLDLPLSKDGNHVTHFLTCVVKGQPVWELKP
ncbi:PAS domain-containing protein [Pacificispira spongiicola]|uniref:PAS domain-containing protein n=1 Tax=Pacificispira spongiicola TaxID=2729598 RepID=UPI001D0C6E66|nr:PAS domain-containing protein [Pacificispira spongiicola]